MSNSLLKDMEEAFGKVGMTMYSDDFCCKLLAWVYIFGGGNEMVTQNRRMFEEITIAQDRLNLKGGEIPNGKLLPLLQQYMREAEHHERGVNPAEWVNTDINARYNIKPYEFKQRNPKDYENEVFYSQRPKAGTGGFFGELSNLFTESE